MQACSSGTQCYNLLGCLQQYGCFDAPDPDACANEYCTAYADGQSALLAFDSCLATNCSSECGVGGG
jgi:hypothetical protein